MYTFWNIFFNNKKSLKFMFEFMIFNVYSDFFNTHNKNSQGGREH